MMGIQLAPNLTIAERFRLNRMLGRGGMGSVWHATHLGLDIPCAVKFIEGEFAQLPEAQARFEREAKAAAQLRSPHVVQILDHGVWQGTPYIAMELLDGEDLGKRLQRVGRLGPQELNPLMQQVCRALTKAHSANIVHRDLKPDNIFLVRDDDREIAKVLDFGIAKANSNAIEGSNTKTGAMLGTPYYMSPEQAQGTKSVDWRSDLWSLGVIVYQCVTGQLPFDSEALGDLLVKIIVNPIPVPSQVAPDVPAAFDRWWAKASSRDPAQRFQTAKEFADSLGLVWGMSQMTDVMDRNALRSALQSGGQIGNQTAPLLTPNGYNMAPAGTPQPGMPNTPNPIAAPAAGMGMGMGNTPMPAMPPGVQAQAPAPTTGGGIARTFNGQVMADGIPKKSSGGLIAAIAIGLVVVVGGAVGIGFAMKGKGDTSAAAGAPTASATTAATTTATATASATAPATASVAATASSEPAPSDSSSATASNAQPPKKAAGAANNPPAPKAPGAGPAPAPAPKPPAGKPKDLGF